MGKFEDVEQLIKEIISVTEESDFIYRGENENHSQITSGLYRKFGNRFQDPITLANIERARIEKGHHLFSSDLKMVEILTEIQHFGGKTSLIDFTSNVFIALYFACNGKYHRHGKLIFLKKEPIKKLDDLYKDNRIADQIILFTPKPCNNRVVFQSSLFVHAPKGYIEAEQIYKILTIKKSFKSEILEFLRKYHNISTETVFQDLIGFIQNEESYDDNATTKFYDARILFDAGDFVGAIKKYTEAIQLRPDDYASYFNRGLCFEKKKLFDEALSDFDKAIQIKPESSEFYRARGNLKDNKGQLDAAIDDYNLGLLYDKKNSAIYMDKGRALLRAGKTKEALECFNKAKRIDPAKITMHKMKIIVEKTREKDKQEQNNQEQEKPKEKK